MTNIKVLTLNCWGLHFPLKSKLRHERITAIGDKLSTGEHDIVLLQEIWDKKDYRLLCTKMNQKMPYSHYFFSGMFGSGICIFSKHPILETLFHQYHLNGYAHQIYKYHGDWYGGKGIGLCKVKFHELVLHFYITHLHAEYSKVYDEYLAHRVAQAYELSQFIRYTSKDCDVSILGGDLNFEPTNLGYRIITSNGGLRDAWMERDSAVDGIFEGGETCDLPSNCFANPVELVVRPNGSRLDYLMYRCNAGHDMTVKECYLTMRKVPNQSYNYSDHEGVAAEFTITDGNGNTAFNDEHRNGSLHEAVDVLDGGLAMAHKSGRMFLALSVFSFICLYLLSCVDVPYGLFYLSSGIKGILTVSLVAGIWFKYVFNNIELSCLLGAKANIENSLRANKYK